MIALPIYVWVREINACFGKHFCNYYHQQILVQFEYCVTFQWKKYSKAEYRDEIIDCCQLIDDM